MLYPHPPSAHLHRFPSVGRVADAMWELAGRGVFGCEIQVERADIYVISFSASGPLRYRVGCGRVVHANLIAFKYKTDRANLPDRVRRALGELGPAIASDVEHFFTAACLVCEHVDEEAGRRRAKTLCAAWDLALSPLQKIASSEKFVGDLWFGKGA